MPRKTFEGARLAEDLSRLSEADRLSPPSARPSLMDVIRAFAVHIETRARLGWTDPMIAAVLTEAGYPIDAATLRSYRRRLRGEGRLPPLGSPAGNDASALPSRTKAAAGLPIPTAAVGCDVAGEVATSQPALPAPATVADASPTPTIPLPAADVRPAPSAPQARSVGTEPGTPRAPPEPSPPGRRSYRLNKAKLPADHA